MPPRGRFLSVLSKNKTEESHSSRRAYLKRVCRLRFSFFANDLRFRARAPQRISNGMLALREGAARAATVSRALSKGGLARLRLEAGDHLRLG
jgi:hypothetical protein